MEDFLGRLHDSPPLRGIAFACTMVAFTLMRLEGLSRLLTPHQASIGVAVGWTVISSLLAMYDILPQASEHSPLFPIVVLLPQQLIFVWALSNRGETTNLASSFLTVIATLSFGLITVQRDPNVAEIPEVLYSENALIGLSLAYLLLCILPTRLATRTRAICLCWSGFLLLELALGHQHPVYVPLVAVLQELSLLNVKMNYFIQAKEENKKL